MVASPEAPTDLTQHWDEVYATRESSELSWFQSDPAVSRRLVESLATPSTAVVDVGAGDSTLVDHLVASGFSDVTLVDLSSVALERVRQRLGPRPGVHVVTGDVLRWRPARPYGLWHDRAVFHFLVDPRDQRRYVEAAAGAVGPSGALVLGCFDQHGPEQCSGLAVARHSAAVVAAIFESAFTLEECEREVHRTPAGVAQSFTWVVLRRV